MTLVIPSVAKRSRGKRYLSLLSEGSKFCAIRRMRTSFWRGAKLAQQERHTTWRDERLRGQREVALPSTTALRAYARDDKV
jgi:hypothetical protein